MGFWHNFGSEILGSKPLRSISSSKGRSKGHLDEVEQDWEFEPLQVNPTASSSKTNSNHGNRMVKKHESTVFRRGRGGEETSDNLDLDPLLEATVAPPSPANKALGTRFRDARLVRKAQNTGPDTTATLQPLAADPEMWLGSNGDPDVMLSVPNLGVDRICLGVDDLRAHVDLHAKVLDLLELHVGADVGIRKVELEIDNVRVQAMLKVRLNEVGQIIGKVVELLEHHPEILSNLTSGLGRGLENALSPEHRNSSAWAVPPVTTTSSGTPVVANQVIPGGEVLDPFPAPLRVGAVQDTLASPKQEAEHETKIEVLDSPSASPSVPEASSSTSTSQP